MSNKILIAGQLPFNINNEDYNIVIGYEIPNVIIDEQEEPKLVTRVYKYDAIANDGKLLDEDEVSPEILEVAKIYLLGFRSGAAYVTNVLSLQSSEQNDIN